MAGAVNVGFAANRPCCRSVWPVKMVGYGAEPPAAEVAGKLR